MHRLLSDISLFAIAIFCYGSNTLAQVSEAEVKRLTSIVEPKLSDPEPYAAEWKFKAMDACKEAFRLKAYPVLEAALRTGDLDVMHTTLELIYDVPIQERKAVLISALEDLRVWRYDPKRMEITAGNVPGMVSWFQEKFCKVISEAFGVSTKYPQFWSKEDRADLAAKIRATGDPAIPPKPPDASATPSATQPVPTIPGAPAPTAATQSPNVQATKGMGPVFWAAIGIAVILAGAWSLKRT